MECYLMQIFFIALAQLFFELLVGIIIGLLVGLIFIAVIKTALKKKKRFLEKRLAIIDSFKTMEAKVGYSRKLLELEIEDIDRKLGEKHA